MGLEVAVLVGLAVEVGERVGEVVGVAVEVKAVEVEEAGVIRLDREGDGVDESAWLSDISEQPKRGQIMITHSKSW